jgi:hypothetical protein
MPRCPRPPGARAALVLLASLLVLHPAPGQAQERSTPAFTIGPALLRGDGDRYTLAARWRWEGRRQGDWKRDRFPYATGLTAHTRGTVAIRPEHNPEPLDAGVNAGVFLALRAPSIETEDPDQPNIGGFDVGSVFLAGQLGMESDQRFDETNGRVAAEVRYVVSRLDGLWPLVPAVHASYAAVLPLNSALRDRAGVESKTHGRFDLNTVWHVPVFRTPLTVHADLLYWNAQHDEPALGALDIGDGLFASLGLGYGTRWRVGAIPIHEVFVRWSGGELPVAPRDRRAWMLGVVAGRR